MWHTHDLRVAATSLLAAGLFTGVHAAEDVDGNRITVLGAEAGIDTPGTFYKELIPCPVAGNLSDPHTWILYGAVHELDTCNQTMLLDFALYNSLNDPSTSVKLRATTVNATNKASSDIATCALSTATEAKLDLAYSSAGAAATKGDDAIAVLDLLQSYYDDAQNCETPFIFGYQNNTVAGLYVGKSFSKASLGSALEGLRAKVRDNGAPERLVTELCGEGRNADHVLGVVLDTAGKLGDLQDVVRGWADAKCAEPLASKGELKGLSIWESTADLGANFNGTLSTNGTLQSNGSLTSRNLQARGDCRVQTVVSGDGCGSLASKCGISSADFTKYNPDKNFCSTLQPEQRVCCSAGTLPDIRPVKNSDGSCKAYTVVKDDNCAKLAARNGLKNEDIEKFNNGTNGSWGWKGCSNILAGINICLSEGTPPVPAPQDGAVCGPTVPGTEFKNDGTKLADLNPCPLNACCNVWGHCGVDQDFCEEDRADSGNPGTSKKQNGCASSCGMEIKKGDAPGSFGRIGYWESWNFNRECLKMRVSNANTDGSYTHIHWAFMSIDTNTWAPIINNTLDQWTEFKALKNVKKIVSFGGWGYSTEPATYDILRQGMNPTNRGKFADAIVKFIKDEGLDGADFDWEYPGATDIDGTPAGSKDDGPNYLKFLTTIKGKMPAGKTVSIAAPASYWYLKNFPIANMAKQLDYIVYMTYDLHGQWDAGNKYSMYGCDSGNCLRSHVNLTETTQVLAMITKAGVSTSKIFVGESSYGRSFHMASAGCDGPDCKFTGDRLHSDAAKGECTDTAGYISNAEINRIIDFGDSKIKSWHDKASNSDMLVYDDVEWVAYMTPTTKSTRRDLWKGYNFAGTIDWAVDLQEFTNDDEILNDDGWDPYWEYPDAPANLPSGGKPENTLKCDNGKSYNSLDDIGNDGSVPVECKPRYILAFLAKNLTNAMSHYDDLMKNNYDKKFDTYAGAVVKGASKQVDKFMREHGNDYFTCEVTEMTFCCDKCKQYAPGFPGGCTYCHDEKCTCNPVTDDCEHKASKRDLELLFGAQESMLESLPMLDARDRPPPGEGLGGHNTIFINKSEPCPPDYSKRGMGQGYPLADTVYWHLRDDRKDQFYADIYSSTGISQENLKFTDKSNSPGDSCMHGWDECHFHNWDMGIIVPDHYEKDDVLNPKDTAVKAHDNLSGVPKQVNDVLDLIKNDKYEGSASDMVDAISIPLFMLEDALENMDNVVDIADEIEEAKRKAIIFAFLSALLFFIPIAGEVVGAIAGMASIARIAALIGTLGDIAMDIYSVVDDPANAPLAIFSLIAGPLALMDIAKVAKAARTQRGMGADDLKKLGGGVSGKLEKIRKINKACPLKTKRSEVVTAPVGAWPMSGLGGQSLPGSLVGF